MVPVTVAEKIDKVVYKIMYIVSLFAALSLVIAALVCTVDSLSTKLFSYSLPNGTEWVTYLNIPIVFLAIGFIQVERGSTTVDIVSQKFPASLKKVLEFVGYFLGFVISGFMTYCEINLTATKLATGAKSSAAAIAFHVWPFALTIAIGYGMAAIAFLWCMFRMFLIPPERRQGAMLPPDMGGADMSKPAGDVKTGDAKAHDAPKADITQAAAEAEDAVANVEAEAEAAVDAVSEKVEEAADAVDAASETAKEVEETAADITEGREDQ